MISCTREAASPVRAEPKENDITRVGGTTLDGEGLSRARQAPGLAAPLPGLGPASVHHVNNHGRHSIRITGHDRPAGQRTAGAAGVAIVEFGLKTHVKIAKRPAISPAGLTRSCGEGLTLPYNDAHSSGQQQTPMGLVTPRYFVCHAQD